MQVPHLEMLGNAPLPERAERAIWEGRTARRREAPSTGRGGHPLSLCRPSLFRTPRRLRAISPSHGSTCTRVTRQR
ncbi:uncharacterized protein SOCE836_107430 [Sorangium cellulosum]|uniref:Uncharacterized protein n=1 Tax=Sorangium cellulosum TaxID=56 RepID=A0A4P2R5U7_SORCE|nr:uncharacterized protein SOCE836_107430 [Sorangium cellulosum]